MPHKLTVTGSIKAKVDTSDNIQGKIYTESADDKNLAKAANKKTSLSRTYHEQSTCIYKGVIWAADFMRVSAASCFDQSEGQGNFNHSIVKGEHLKDNSVLMIYIRVISGIGTSDTLDLRIGNQTRLAPLGIGDSATIPYHEAAVHDVLWVRDSNYVADVNQLTVEVIMVGKEYDPPMTFQSYLYLHKQGVNLTGVANDDGLDGIGEGSLEGKVGGRGVNSWSISFWMRTVAETIPRSQGTEIINIERRYAGGGLADTMLNLEYGTPSPWVHDGALTNAKDQFMISIEAENKVGGNGWTYVSEERVMHYEMDNNLMPHNPDEPDRLLHHKPWQLVTFVFERNLAVGAGGEAVSCKLYINERLDTPQMNGHNYAFWDNTMSTYPTTWNGAIHPGTGFHEFPLHMEIRTQGSYGLDVDINGLSFWNKALDLTDITELFNGRKDFDNRTHTHANRMTGYYTFEEDSAALAINPPLLTGDSHPNIFNRTLHRQAFPTLWMNSTYAVRQWSLDTSSAGAPGNGKLSALFASWMGGAEMNGGNYTSSVMKVAPDTTINMSPSGDVGDADFCISAWIKPRGYGENDEARILDKRGSEVGDGGNAGYSLSLRDTVGSEKTFAAVVARAGTNAVSVAAENTLEYKMHTWSHIMITYNHAVRTIRLYLNGVECSYHTQTAGSAASPANDNTFDLCIGGHATADIRWFDGHITDVAVIKGLIPSGGVDYIYNDGIPWDIRDYVNTAIRGYWTFDDATGRDISGNGNDAIALTDVGITGDTPALTP